jgi:phospholipid/cholesterol/gamma-HCH transport system permease protein
LRRLDATSPRSAPFGAAQLVLEVVDPSPPSFRIEPQGDALRLSGDLRMRDAGQLWKAVRGATRRARSGPLAIDLAGVEHADGGAAALLVELRAELADRGVDATIVGANERVAALVELYGGDPAKERFRGRRPEGLIEQVGRVATEWWSGVRDAVAFLGSMVTAVGAIARRPRAGHFGEVPSLSEKAGADALPIVLLINFLVGFVMAFQAASQLIRFGANIYVADLVGLSMTRELAPLMTAIIICGRSGAAYAAEIGSMKVSEEIDALRTMGLTPFAWLVVPRVLTLVIVAPILTLFGSVIGVTGGLVVAVTSLDLTAYGYITETQKAVSLWDVQSGLIKSAVFGLAIALIACQQGFAASGGAEGVGRRTTSTVVTSLFVLVLLDAGFTVFYRSTGLMP